MAPLPGYIGYRRQYRHQRKPPLAVNGARLYEARARTRIPASRMTPEMTKFFISIILRVVCNQLVDGRGQFIQSLGKGIILLLQALNLGVFFFGLVFQLLV